MNNTHISLSYFCNKYKMLLEERKHVIGLAKIICPAYHQEDEHWKIVTTLLEKINEVKEEMW